jgi:DNA-binding response OmpR family regulator
MRHYDISRLRILLVEEEHYMRNLYRSVLKALGIDTIYTEGNLDRGFEVCMSTHPDIVITDWKPTFDGLNLTTRIRNEEGKINLTPVIVISAYSEFDRIAAARDNGANQFLVKPFNAAKLYERIGATIEDEQQFILDDAYRGPCRRRRTTDFEGDDRRASV